MPARPTRGGGEMVLPSSEPRGEMNFRLHSAAATTTSQVSRGRFSASTYTFASHGGSPSPLDGRKGTGGRGRSNEGRPSERPCTITSRIQVRGGSDAGPVFSIARLATSVRARRPALDTQAGAERRNCSPTTARTRA